MVCNKCGREFSDQVTTCPYCGADSVDPADTETKNNKYCIYCGKKISHESVFCAYCGQKQPGPNPAADFSPSKDGSSDTVQQSDGSDNKTQETKDTEKSATTENPSETQDSSSASAQSGSESLKDIVQEVKKSFSEAINTEGETRNDVICPFCGAEDCQPMQKSTTEIKQKNYGWGSGCCGMLLLGPFGLLCGLCGAGSKTKVTSELWWTCTKCGKQHLALDDALKKWDAMIDALLVDSVMLAIVGAIVRYLDIGILTALVVIGSFAFPLVMIYGAYQELSEELGAPIDNYLNPEQKKTCLWKVLGAIVILLVGSFLGLRLLESIAAS